MRVSSVCGRRLLLRERRGEQRIIARWQVRNPDFGRLGKSQA